MKHDSNSRGDNWVDSCKKTWGILIVVLVCLLGCINNTADASSNVQSEATPIPTSTALPSAPAKSADEAQPQKLKLQGMVYENGEVVEWIKRDREMEMLYPFTTTIYGDDYALWRQAGVLTFRSGPFRQNASYGFATVQEAKLSQKWVQPISGTGENRVTGQPVIVKWAIEIRMMIGLTDEAKETKVLTEVMVTALDGKIYFYSLFDGMATRDPIDLGAPSHGGLSLATNVCRSSVWVNAAMACKTMKLRSMGIKSLT